MQASVYKNESIVCENLLDKGSQRTSTFKVGDLNGTACLKKTMSKVEATVWL